MTRPYLHRFMLLAPGSSEAIELVRFHRGITNCDRKAWLGSLDPAWTIIEEHAKPIPEHKRLT